jgi:hypothetical protein
VWRRRSCSRSVAAIFILSFREQMRATDRRLLKEGTAGFVTDAGGLE